MQQWRRFRRKRLPYLRKESIIERRVIKLNTNFENRRIRIVHDEKLA
jgi:hypothetical protein